MSFSKKTILEKIKKVSKKDNFYKSHDQNIVNIDYILLFLNINKYYILKLFKNTQKRNLKILNNFCISDIFNLLLLI